MRFLRDEKINEKDFTEEKLKNESHFLTLIKNHPNALIKALGEMPHLATFYCKNLTTPVGLAYIRFVESGNNKLPVFENNLPPRFLLARAS